MIRDRKVIKVLLHLTDQRDQKVIRERQVTVVILVVQVVLVIKGQKVM